MPSTFISRLLSILAFTLPITGTIATPISSTSDSEAVPPRSFPLLSIPPAIIADHPSHSVFRNGSTDANRPTVPTIGFLYNHNRTRTTISSSFSNSTSISTSYSYSSEDGDIAPNDEIRSLADIFLSHYGLGVNSTGRLVDVKVDIDVDASMDIPPTFTNNTVVNRNGTSSINTTTTTTTNTENHPLLGDSTFAGIVAKKMMPYVSSLNRPELYRHNLAIHDGEGPKNDLTVNGPLSDIRPSTAGDTTALDPAIHQTVYTPADAPLDLSQATAACLFRSPDPTTFRICMCLINDGVYDDMALVSLNCLRCEDDRDACASNNIAATASFFELVKRKEQDKADIIPAGTPQGLDGDGFLVGALGEIDIAILEGFMQGEEYCPIMRAENKRLVVVNDCLTGEVLFGYEMQSGAA